MRRLAILVSWVLALVALAGIGIGIQASVVTLQSTGGTIDPTMLAGALWGLASVGFGCVVLAVLCGTVIVAAAARERG